VGARGAQDEATLAEFAVRLGKRDIKATLDEFVHYFLADLVTNDDKSVETKTAELEYVTRLAEYESSQSLIMKCMGDLVFEVVTKRVAQVPHCPPLERRALPVWGLPPHRNSPALGSAGLWRVDGGEPGHGDGRFGAEPDGELRGVRRVVHRRQRRAGRRDGADPAIQTDYASMMPNESNLNCCFVYLTTLGYTIPPSRSAATAS
jgi:hypothetical protein